MYFRFRSFFILALFSFLFSANGSAQKKTVGIHLNGTRSLLDGYSMIQMLFYAPKYDVSFGASYQQSFGRYIGMSLKLNYINVGSGFEDARNDGINDNLNPDISVKANLRYLQLPVMIDIIVLNERRLFLTSGFYASFLLKGDLKGSMDDYAPYLENTEIDLSLDDQLNKLDAGFVAGIGSQIPLNEELELNLGATFNLGLLKLEKKDKAFQDFNLKNRYFNLEVGLAYRIK